MLLQALSDAADEITRELAPGSVEVRLRGLDPDFVVTPPPSPQWLGEAAEPAAEHALPAPPPGDEGATARINLRLPEQLKLRAEEAAGREGLSLNAWLVRAVAGTLDAGGDSRPHRRPPSSGQRFTGWVR